MKKKFLTSVSFALLIVVGVLAQQPASLEPSPARLQQYVSYLASDALNGRRTGTQGANDAAHYVAGEFSRIGLRPGAQSAGSAKLSQVMARYLQSFPYVSGVELGKANSLSLSGSVPATNVEVGVDWMPLGFSANGTIENSSVVFVGYGISAAELNHDDYANNRARGRIALALAGTPDGDNPHGQFARYESVRWKAVAAKNAGAKALLIVSREEKLKEDRLATLTFDNSAGDAGLPVALVSQRLIGGKESFDKFEKEIKQQINNFDQSSTASLTIDLIRKDVAAYNVIGVLEGADPLLKNETIIIGAHYDHLGRGGEGSLAPRSGEVHHGADDNASGVAGMLELARLLTAQRPRLKRTVVFMAFGGEEEGLLGSNYYVNHPITPLAKTVAMINMDMIGRMKDRKLIIGGVGTAKEWRDILNASESPAATAIKSNAGTSAMVPVGESSSEPRKSFDITLQEDGYGPSDHSSFYAKQIPVLFFWTGNHSDYHKPSDTYEKINYTDEARLLGFIWRVVRQIDQSEKRLTYTTAKSDSQAGRATGFRVYLGTIPNYADSGDGLLLDGVRDDSPAAKAGLKAGDRIVKIGEREIKNVYDYTYALGEMKAGQEYAVEVVRGTDRLSLKIKPEARK